MIRARALARGVVALSLLIAAGGDTVLSQAQQRAPARTPPPRASDTARAPSVAVAVDSTPGAPVIFQDDTLFRLYGTLGPFTPEQRARAAGDKLMQLARSRPSGADSILPVPRDGFVELRSGALALMVVLDSDAAPLGVSRDRLARDYVNTIRRALAAARDRVSARALLVDAGLAAATTLSLLIALWLLRLTFPRLYRRMEVVRRARIPGVRIQQFELISAERVSHTLLILARALRVAVTVVLFYIYVPLVLSFFPWTEPLSRRIVGYALTPLASAWSAFIGYVPSVFYLLVIALVTRYALKLIHAIFRAVENGALTFEGFYREWAEPTYKIARVLVLAFAAVLSFPYLPGAHTDAFKGVSLFLGVLFSLGSSSAISNIVAGVVLTYTRAFHIGDRVQIGETVGDVTERTLLVTRVRTIKNVEVTIPNGTVLSAQVLNYTRLAAERGLVLHTTVTIGYDAPWQTVHDLLIAAARRTEYVLADPAPFVLQTSLDDFYVSYQLNAYTAHADRMAGTYSMLHANIQDAFNEAGMEIMSPHYGALRDGNQIAIPAASVPPSYEVPAFRVSLGRDAT